ncbi:MAG TPA: hypothetical protein VF840_09870 [Terriglobales bacterium]
MKTKVDPDPVGDLDYANNTLTQTVATANWHLTVSGHGVSDADPLVISVTSGGTSWSNSATVNLSVDGGGTFSLGGPLVPFFGINVYSAIVGTGLNAPTGPLCSFSAPGNCAVAISTNNSSLQNGFYAVQMVARTEVLGSGSMTVQRQATIHVQVSNVAIPSPYALGVSCTHNGASCVAGTGPATTIQVNGALTEQYIATVCHRARRRRV